MRPRVLALIFGVSQLACFVQGDTFGLPCTENEACFDGLVCSQGLCVEPSMADEATTPPDGGDGDGDITESGDGDGDTTEDGDGDPTESGDGDGDGDPTDSGDGDPTESGDGDGDGDGDPDPNCGDGIAQANENCDGTDLKGKTCSDFNYGGGMLACSECAFVFDGCCQGSGQSCLVSSDCCGNMTCGLIPPLVCQ